MPSAPPPGSDTRGSGARRRLALGALCLFSLFGVAPASAAPSAPRVRVLGPADRPIPGAEVFVARDARWVKAGVTGPDGRFTWADAPTDGTAMVAARFRTGPYDPEHELLAGVPTKGAETVLRVAAAAELTVTGTDARTGRPVRGFRWRDDPKGPFAAEPRIRPLGPSGLGEAFDGLDVEAPNGYVSWDPTVREKWQMRFAALGWTSGIAPGVSRVVATYPLRPEARIAFSLQGASGMLRIDACQWRFVGDTDFHSGVGSSVAGATHVVVPWFPGATVEYELAGATEAEEGPIPMGLGRVTLGPDPGLPVSAVARVVPREGFTSVPPLEEEGLIGRGGGGPSPGGGTVLVHLSVRSGALPEDQDIDLESTATRAIEGGGRSPVLFRRSRVGTSGLARFEGVQPAEYVAVFWRLGYLPAVAVCRVSAGRTTEVDLREPVGGVVEVSVVGPEGRPLPFARLGLDGENQAAPLDVVDGVQRVDPFVGVDGKRTWDRVAPGPVTIEAVWGSLRGEVRGVVEDGKPLALRIEARDGTSR